MTSTTQDDQNQLRGSALYNNLTVVIKSSKLCNLRCRYCYEFDQLSNAERIPIHMYRSLFENIKQIASIMDSNVKFCWHGGEPLLLPTTYYEEAFAIRDACFGERKIDIIQTNLFHLDKRRLETIKLFRYVSISYDVYGAERVTLTGHNSGDAVIDNMDTLRQYGFKFGVINVLTQRNISRIDDIFSFFNEANLTVRILPFYRTAYSKQTDTYGLKSTEIRNSFLRLIDLYFQQGRKIRIFPIEYFISCAIRYLYGASESEKFNRSIREHVLMIDVNGDVYASGTAYDNDYRYGNIFHDDVNKLLYGAGRKRMVQRSQELMSEACHSCPYFGFSCSGFYVAEQTDVEIAANDSDLKCPVIRPCIDRAVEWLRTIKSFTMNEISDEAYL